MISWSRTAALSKYYSAPLLVYAQLPDAITKKVVEVSGSTESSTITVCTCGEWYRYPSSFYIESEPSEVVFGFAPSTFMGQLPQPFTKEGSGTPVSFVNRFNNKNEPEAGSYTSLDKCDFLVELSTESCAEQNGGNSDDMQWEPILKAPFLDTETTTSSLHRILYIPHLHDHGIKTGKVQYSNFVLYGRI